MAGVSSQIPTNSVTLMSPSPTKISNFSTSLSNSIKFPAKKCSKPSLCVTRRVGKKPGFGLRAGTDEGVLVVEEVKEDLSEIGLLKKQLVDSFYGTNMGLSATSETRAEIVELITKLEAKNPTPEPTSNLPLLSGKWILAYTSFVGLYPFLSSGTMPVVKIEEISQTIDCESFTVQNCVVVSGLGSKTEFTTKATFEVRSPRRIQLKFDEGIIGTPQLTTDSIEIPESIEILGQKIDLAPFKGLITSVEDTASNVAKTISDQPPWRFSISQTNAESWLLTTYLDEELRISRADGGKVFVLLKEGSALLLP